MGLFAVLGAVWLWHAQAAPMAADQPDLAGAIGSLKGALRLEDAQAAAQAMKMQFGLPGAAPLPGLPFDTFAVGGNPVVELVDLRLLLAQIAVQTGAKDHLALDKAQNDGPHQVILLRGGMVSLTGLLALIGASDAADFVTSGPQGVVFKRAVVVWPDAGLTLETADRVILSRADGSFLVNLGWLNIQGARIEGSASANRGAAEFRPFVLTAGRGSMTAAKATFAHLGFGQTPHFGGVAVVNSGLQPPRMPSAVRGSAFDDVMSLAFIHTDLGTLAANKMTDGAILVSHSSKAVVSDNLLVGGAGHAIRVSGGSVDAVVANNIVLGAVTGLSVDQSSARITLTGNVLSGQDSSAIRLDKVDCVQVFDNLAVQGAGAGVSLSNTGRVSLAGNAILGNAGSGILLRDQRERASVSITGNQIADNHEGLRGATAGFVFVTGNDMEGQLPRLFSGDLAPRTIGWLEERRDKGRQRLLADRRSVCPARGRI